MAAVFRVTKDVLLKRINNVDTAFGKVFQFYRFGLFLLFLDRVLKKLLADLFVRWSISWLVSPAVKVFTHTFCHPA